MSTAAAPFVAYLRVSTDAQGERGLGVEAQRAALVKFAAEQGRPIVAEFVEVASGKGADALTRRPKLAEALRISAAPPWPPYGGLGQGEAPRLRKP